jgi:hypothetical protein
VSVLVSVPISVLLELEPASPVVVELPVSPVLVELEPTETAPVDDVPLVVVSAVLAVGSVPPEVPEALLVGAPSVVPSGFAWVVPVVAPGSTDGPQAATAANSHQTPRESVCSARSLREAIAAA